MIKRGKIKQRLIKLYFIFCSVYIIQITRKSMHNKVTEQIILENLYAMITEVFSLTK